MARRKKKSRNPRPAAAISDCNSEWVQRRLSRIEENYELLDDLLADLESKVPHDILEPPIDSLPNKPR